MERHSKSLFGVHLQGTTFILVSFALYIKQTKAASQKKISVYSLSANRFERKYVVEIRRVLPYCSLLFSRNSKNKTEFHSPSVFKKIQGEKNSFNWEI